MPSYCDSPWAKHRVSVHSLTHVDVSVAVEYVIRDTVKRKIAEAHLIRTLQPTINCRDEMRKALQLIGLR